jgi:hypothetical protein
MIINGSAINGAAINAAGGAIIITEDVLETAPITNPEPVTYISVRVVEDTIDPDPAVVTNPEPVTDGYVFETAVVTNPAPLANWYRQIDETAVIISNYYELLRVVTEDVLETAVLNDGYTTLRTTRIDFVDDAVVLSNYYELLRVVTTDLLDTAELGSLITEGAPPADLLDVAVVTSITTPRSILYTDVLEGLAGGDDIFPASYFSQLDTAVVVSAIGPVAVGADLSDTAVVTSLVTLGGDTQTVDVLEQAEFESFITTQLTVIEAVFETAYLESWISSPDGTDAQSGWSSEDAWTCDTGGWAMSRHTNVGITNRGVRFAVSEDGLFEEDTTFVAARIETGYMDFATANKKRISNIYMHGSYVAPISVDVTAEVNGVRMTYKYTPLTDITGVPTVVRVDVGKKICSSYYKFGVDTTGRAELFMCDALTTAVQRKI